MKEANIAKSVRKFLPWVAVVLTGVLMVGSFAPWNDSILAWVAMLPLLTQIFPLSPSKSCTTPFRFGFGAGWIFWLLTIQWLRHVTVLGMVSLTMYLALYMGAWSYFIARIQMRWKEVKGWVHLLVACFGASAWVVLEWIRGWALGGFPWNFVGASQYQNLALIQIAEWTGIYGVSFVIVFFNLSLWLTWRRLREERFLVKSWRYEFSVAIFLVVFCLFIGVRHLLKSQDTIADTAGSRNQLSLLNLALLQPNIPQEVKYEVLSREDQQQRLASLSRASAVLHPDLIVWPETALVDSPSMNSASRHWLQQLAHEIKTPILLGMLDVSSVNPSNKENHWHVDYYNAATLIEPDGVWAPPYHKLHLVPFGEYVPFEHWTRWMSWFIPVPISLKEGEHPVLFAFRGLQLAPLICFEDTFPYLARAMSRSGADVLINLTNDAWFRDSPAAVMHAANAVFRAIETRRPLVRCTNNGMTLVVAPTGQILSHGLKPFCKGFLIVALSCRRHLSQTFFVHYGDWFPWLCVGILLVSLGVPKRSP